VRAARIRRSSTLLFSFIFHTSEPHFFLVFFCVKLRYKILPSVTTTTGSTKTTQHARTHAPPDKRTDRRPPPRQHTQRKLRTSDDERTGVPRKKKNDGRDGSRQKNDEHRPRISLHRSFVFSSCSHRKILPRLSNNAEQKTVRREREIEAERETTQKTSNTTRQTTEPSDTNNKTKTCGSDESPDDRARKAEIAGQERCDEEWAVRTTAGVSVESVE
jgi:hypothetical protein